MVHDWLVYRWWRSHLLSWSAATGLKDEWEFMEWQGMPLSQADASYIMMDLITSAEIKMYRIRRTYRKLLLVI